MRIAIALSLVFFSNSVRAQEDCSGLLSGPLEWRLLYSSASRGDVIEVRGFPRSAIRYQPGRDEVFRYYVSNPDVHSAILEQSALRAGVLPYVVNEPGLKKEYYIDLTGVFLTKPGFEPHQVGLDANPEMNSIDFTVSPETQMIRLEAGIFLIPGKPAYPAWVREAYQRWKQDAGVGNNGLPDAVFRRMQERESLPDLLIPIKITGQR